MCLEGLGPVVSVSKQKPRKWAASSIPRFLLSESASVFFDREGNRNRMPRLRYTFVPLEKKSSEPFPLVFSHVLM